MSSRSSRSSRIHVPPPDATPDQWRAFIGEQRRRMSALAREDLDLYREDLARERRRVADLGELLRSVSVALDLLGDPPSETFEAAKLARASYPASVTLAEELLARLLPRVSEVVASGMVALGVEEDTPDHGPELAGDRVRVGSLLLHRSYRPRGLDCEGAYKRTTLAEVALAGRLALADELGA